MKKFAKIGLILAIIALVVACSKESSDTLAEDKINMDLINAVGIPAKIYSAQNTSARYITGEIIEEGDKKYRFQGNLVEYSFVNPIILNAFDEVPTSSLIHQEYNDVSYDSSKAYIEVCYYEDVESGEKIAYELRLIDDSYFNHSYSNWHAKEIEFGNEDLEEIKFFKKTKNQKLQEVIDIIGTAEAVFYDEYSEEGFLVTYYDGTQHRDYCCLVAFSSVTKAIEEFFETVNITAKLQWGNDYISRDKPNQNMIYIEVIYSEDLDSYELRLVDDSYFDKSYLNNSEEHWYAKVFEFSDLSDIQGTQNP